MSLYWHLFGLILSLALIALLQAQARQCICYLSISRTTSSLRLVFGVNKYLICGSKAEKDPRPVLKKGQSGDKHLHFKKQWVRYRMESNLVVEQIRDQLLAYSAGRT